MGFLIQLLQLIFLPGEMAWPYKAHHRQRVSISSAEERVLVPNNQTKLSACSRGSAG